MNKADVESLFRLLLQLFPTAKGRGGSVQQATWQLALEPYDCGAVHAAAVAYARTNKFFPDLADLTAGLTAPPKGVLFSPAELACFRRDSAALDKVLAQTERDRAAGVLV